MKLSSLILLSLLSSGITSYSKQTEEQLQIDPETGKKTTYDISERVLVAQSYSKIFDENFSGNLAKWNIYEGGAYNNELQLYRNNLSIDNGILTITAKKENLRGKVYPETEEHLTLNLAVGSDIFGKDFDNSTIKTDAIKIDRVRVYSSK